MANSTVLARAAIVLSGDVSQLDEAFGSAVSKLQRAGERMQQIGNELSLKVTLPILGVGTAATRMAGMFDDSLRKMEALTGVPRETIEKWRGEVRELAVTYGKTAQEASEGLFFIASAGIRVDQVMEAMEASLKGSAVGLGDTQVVADAATSAINAYASQNMTATRAIEIMTAAVREGKAEADEMAPVLGNLLPLASKLGISFEQIAGTLAVFSRTGTSASEGATSLQAIMSTLLSTSQEGEDLLASVGLSLEDLREQVQGPRGLVNVMRLLEEAFDGNESKLQAVIPNIRALRGVMNALAQDASSVDVVLNNVAASQGVLEDAWVKVQGPMLEMRKSFARIKDAMVELGAVLIPVVVPQLTKVSTAVRAAAKWFGDLSPVMQRVTILAAGLAAALGPMLVVLGSLAKAFVAIKLAGFIAGIKTVAGLVLPGGALLVGLGLLAAAFFKIKLRAQEAADQAEAAAKAFRLSLAEMDEAEAARGIEQIKADLDDVQQKLDNIQRLDFAVRTGMPIDTSHLRLLPKELQDQITAAMDEQGKVVGRARRTIEAALLAEGSALEANRAQWRENIQVLEATVERAEAARAAVVGEEGGDKTKTPAWIEPTKEALKGLGASLRQTKDMAKLFGEQFDRTGAEMAAYEEFLKAAVEAGAPFTFQLEGQNISLAKIARRLIENRDAMEQAQRAAEKYENAMADATRTVQQGMTIQDRYKEQILNLQAALLTGRIGWAQYRQGAEEAKRALEDALDKGAKSIGDLERAAISMTENGLQSIADFAAGSKDAFRDFVDFALREIQRLVIKMAALKFVTEVLGLEVPGLQHGGFLKPGEIGLVGEAGKPELISGGRHGVTVTPMAGHRSDGDGGGGGTTNMNVNISAVDSRDVMRLFEENGPALTGIMMRTMRRSSTMQRAFFGG